MRLPAFVGVVLVASLVTLGAVMLIMLTTPNPDPVWAGLAAGALSIFLFGATLLGSLRAQWDLDGAESQRLALRWLLAVVIGEIAASALLVASAIVMGTPAWVVPLLIAIGVAATIVSARVGAGIRAHEVRSPWAAEPRVDLTRIARRAALVMTSTFVITLGVVLVTLIVIQLALDEALGGVGHTALVAVGAAFFATAFAGIVVGLPVQRRLRAVTSGDFGRARRFGRAVFRGKPERIETDELPATLEFASVAMVATGFQWASMVCLYFGFGLQQLASILRRPEDVLIPTIVIAGLCVVALALVPFVALQQRHARRFRTEHAGDTTA